MLFLEEKMVLSRVIKRVLIVIVSLFWQSCAAQKVDVPMGKIEGTVGLLEGNCMPGPDQTPCEPTPLSTTIYITQPSELFDQNLLIDSVVSNVDGVYLIELPPGNYSVFVRDKGEVQCPYLTCPADCYCTYISLESNAIIKLDLTIDHALW